MLQSWRGKAAIGKALCLSRYLSPSLAEGVQYSILFEQLSLTLFILFGSGLSGLGYGPGTPPWLFVPSVRHMNLH